MRILPAVRKNSIFIVSLVCVIGLSFIRSFPVYGKLDFILLDGRSWWEPLRPMIEEIIGQGDEEILSDMITCTILRGVFAQKAVAFRFDRRYSNVQVEDFLKANKEKKIPYGAVSLCLKDNIVPANTKSQQAESTSLSVHKILVEAVMDEVERRNNPFEQKKFPYRCLINLHGFESSWVPTETGHWSVGWSKPYLMYEFQGKHGKEIEPLLKKNLPENCMVYF